MAEEPEQFFLPPSVGWPFPSLWSSSLSTLLGWSLHCLYSNEGNSTLKEGFTEENIRRVLKYILLSLHTIIYKAFRLIAIQFRGTTFNTFIFKTNILLKLYRK